MGVHDGPEYAIMRINEDLEIEVLFDASTEEAKLLMHNGSIAYSKLLGTGRNNINLEEIPIVKEVQFGGYQIVEYENGSISVHEQGKIIIPTKPILRDLAATLNIPIFNGSGNQHNTRSLGSLIISSVINQQNIIG
tara:strand:+ start:6000 stop:6407 length:408 start_codon:yes stop_codon:yes gene_type:complete